MQNSAGNLEITFPKARHVLQKKEWEDVMAPNSRNINTYWPVNNELIRDNRILEIIDGEVEVVPGITVMRTGGHNRGHQIVRIVSQGKTAYHLGDLLPTHAHVNPLWVMAYDNFPLESIKLKETWIKKCVDAGAWCIFYHDAFIRACRFDTQGAIVEQWPKATGNDAG